MTIAYAGCRMSERTAPPVEARLQALWRAIVWV